jgi:hypothetical protein
MDKENRSFFRPSHPFIIVKEINKKVIEETIKAYAECILVEILSFFKEN